MDSSLLGAVKLLAWVEQSFPAARESLRGPASAELLALVKQPLPPSLEALWRAHDGQEDLLGARLFERFALLSVREALDAAALMTQVLQEVAREYGSEERWLTQWLPFAQDIGGGLLVVDLVSGEVFEWQSDAEGRERTWGASFDGFLEDYLARFTSGELRVDEKHGVVKTKPAPPPVRVEPVIPTQRKVIGAALVALYLLGMALFMYWLEARRG